MAAVMLVDAMEHIQVGDRGMSEIGTIVVYVPPHYFKNPKYWSGWDGGEIKIDWDNGRTSHSPIWDDVFCSMDMVGRAIIVG